MNLLDLPRDILLRIFTSMPLVYFTDATTSCKKINKLFRYYMSNMYLSNNIQSSQSVYCLAYARIGDKIAKKFSAKLSGHVKKRTKRKFKKLLNKNKQREQAIHEFLAKNYNIDPYIFEYFILKPTFCIDLKSMEEYKLARRCLNVKNGMIAKYAGFHDLPYEHTELTAYKHGRIKAGRPVIITKNLLKYAVKYDYELPEYSRETYAYSFIYAKKELANKHDHNSMNDFNTAINPTITIKILVLGEEYLTAWMLLRKKTKISDKYIRAIYKGLEENNFEVHDTEHRNRIMLRTTIKKSRYLH